MDSEKTAQIVSSWYSAMGSWDFDTLMNTLDNDVVFILADNKPYTKQVPYLGTWVGKEAFGKASQIRNETSQISGFEVLEVIAQGNKAAARVISKSTCIATGIYFELDITQWLELNDDGKITKVTAIFDPLPEIDAFAGKKA
jgi:ketosteroid isomerase-like protein